MVETSKALQAFAGRSVSWVGRPVAMGFLPETDQGTTSGQKKPANRAGLPSEKPDNSQQSAMEVIAKVHQQRLPAADLLQDLLVRQFKTVASVCGAIPAIPCSCTLMGNRVTSTHLCLAIFDMLDISQIQKGAAVASVGGEKFPPHMPFLNTHQAPCMVAVGNHFQDSPFMATFLNQVCSPASECLL